MTVQRALAQQSRGLGGGRAPVHRFDREVRHVAERLDGAPQVGRRRRRIGQQGGDGRRRLRPVAQIAMTEDPARRRRLRLFRHAQQGQQQTIAVFHAQDVADEAGVQDGGGEDRVEILGPAQGGLDGGQFDVGEAQRAQGCVVDARRLDQGAATERPPFRRLDIAARRRDGLGKRGVQPATDLAIGRLEHIDRRDATQAQPQPRLRILDE